MEIPSAWQAAKEALRFGRTRFGLILKCAVVPILASFAVEQVLQRGRIESGLDVLFVVYLLALAFFVSIQFTIKITRLFIFNEAPKSMFSLEEMFSPRAGRYLLNVLLLELVTALFSGSLALLALGLASLTKIKALSVVGLVLVALASLYLMYGLSFVIPGVVLDVPVGMKRSLTLTRGIKLKLIGAMFLVSLPMIAAEAAAFTPGIIMVILKVTPSDFALGAMSLASMTIMEVGHMVAMLPILVLFKAKAMAQAPQPVPAVQAA